MKEVNAALAYAQEKTKKATGETQSYLSRLDIYKKSKDITRRNLYLKGMKNSLRDNKKIFIDPRVGVPDVWLKSDYFISTFGLGED